LRKWNGFKGSQSFASSAKIWTFGSVNLKSLFEERCTSAGYTQGKFSMDSLHKAHGYILPVSFLPRANGFRTDLRCILSPLDSIHYDHLLDRSVKGFSLGSMYETRVQIQETSESSPHQHPTPCEEEIQREVDKNPDFVLECQRLECSTSMKTQNISSLRESKRNLTSTSNPNEHLMGAFEHDSSEANPVSKRIKGVHFSKTGQEKCTERPLEIHIPNTLYRRRRRMWTDKETRILVSSMDSKLSWVSLLADLQRNGFNRTSYDCMQEYLCHQKTLAKDPVLPVSFILSCIQKS
jgi:hypothetical protein